MRLDQQQLILAELQGIDNMRICPEWPLSMNARLMRGKVKGTCSAYVGCFPLCQRFRKFRLEFKWKGPFRFLLTGIFGITCGGGPHISVGIFRPKFAVPFLTNGFFALIREFGKRIQNDESHFYWLARFNRKVSFHFPQVFPLISDRSV